MNRRAVTLQIVDDTLAEIGAIEAIARRFDLEDRLVS
jgi:hypothetical protein